MYRHISIFKLMEQPTNGKTKEENLAAIRTYLDTIPAQLPTVVASKVGVNVTNKTKEENLAAIRTYLDTIPAQLPTVVASKVGVNVTNMPPMPDDAPVMFGDLVQIIDFATREDSDAYGPSAAHGGLVALSEGAMKKVVAIDFEL